MAAACVIAGIALFGQSQKPEPPKPEYFDQPNFIAAGVADPGARGGHGADAVSHSADSLAKATASLRTEASGVADESALRQAIAREPNRADLHHALAAVLEKKGSALEAVREYQRAAELDPAEPYLFDWGAELLEHRATAQAVAVFTKGTRSFPRSMRLLLGLAVALYSRGGYADAGQRFFAATDVNPGDPEPYLFLGRVSTSAIADLPGFSQRIQRFERTNPQNAWANYYYAVDLCRHGHAAECQGHLEKAVQIDPHFGDAFLRLGVLFSDQENVKKAIEAYEQAAAVRPSMAETHYRLSQAYRKTGEIAKAQKELEVFQQLERESAAAQERERSEIQQFVFELRKR